MTTAAGSRVNLLDGAHTGSRSSLELDVFNAFPYGLLVLDHGGRVVCHNEAATQLIEDVDLPATDLSCCALLGCRKPGTVLASACLTELALSRDSALPEVRVDIATLAGPSAVWVAASVIEREGRRVVLQLRPGIAQDRRQRTDPHWMTGPRLRVRALGKTEVESAEGPIGGAWLDQRAGQLLKYLIAERHRAVTVDEIGESVWPGASYGVGGSVRYYVHALRRRLEPGRGLREPSAFIAASSGAYRLNLTCVDVDVDEFEALVTAGLAGTDDDPQAPDKLERGLSLYRGEFLADLPYTEWAMAERHRLHDLACMGLRRLADIRMERRLIDGATRCMERLATFQPYDEDVHRRLMELDIMQGRRSDAVRRYATLRSRIRRTFGHDPDFTPADLARPRPQPE